MCWDTSCGLHCRCSEVLHRFVSSQHPLVHSQGEWCRVIATEPYAMWASSACGWAGSTPACMWLLNSREFGCSSAGWDVLCRAGGDWGHGCSVVQAMHSRMYWKMHTTLATHMQCSALQTFMSRVRFVVPLPSSFNMTAFPDIADLASFLAWA